MGFSGRFAAAYGTVWLAPTVMLFMHSPFQIGEGGLLVMLLGCAGWAKVTAPKPPALPAPPPAAPLPPAVATFRDDDRA